MTEPIVRCTYYDPFWEWEDGDATEVNLTTVVGWRLPEKYPGHVRIASEKSTTSGWRSITHIPEDCIALITEEEE